MKKSGSLLLAALMLLFCFLPVRAEQSVVPLISFQNETDFSGWKRRSFDITDNHKNLNFARVGKHSLKMVDFNIENNWSFSLNQSITGMSYLNMWLYCDNPNGITIDFRPTIGGKTVITQWTVTLNWTGWKRFSFPLTGKTGNITEIKFSTEGYGFGSRGDKHDGYPVNTVDNLAAGVMSLNYMWLSATEPQETDFGASFPTNGADLVKHNLSEIGFAAKNICSGSLQSGKVTITPTLGFEVRIEKDKLLIVPQETLTFGTTYTVSLDDGFYDENGMNFKATEISFRVRGENENIPPEITLLSPTAQSRFFPQDVISLEAEASDDDGAVEYVEFYCDNVSIGKVESVSEKGTYCLEWSEHAENLDGNEITAVACDDKGAETRSAAVRILIADLHEPQITLISPKSGSKLYHSVSGIPQKNDLTISAESLDSDGTVTEVRFYLNDTLLHTETDDVSSASYVYSKALAPGEYRIHAEAVDNDGLSAESETVLLTVSDMGKQLPELAQRKTQQAWAERICNKKLDTGLWQAEAELMCSPKAVHTLSLAGTSTYDVLTFRTDGSIYAEGKDTGLRYKAGEKHSVKLVINPETSLLACVLDGVIVLDGMSCNAAVYANGATLSLSNAEEEVSCFTDAAFYRLGDAASLESVSFYAQNGTKLTDTNAVPVDLDSIVLAFAGGIKEIPKDSVSLKAKLSGEEVPLSVENGKIYLKGILKSDSVYCLGIGSDISDSNGAGLCGDEIFEFQSAKNPVTVRFSSEAESLSEADEVTVTALVTNNTTGEQNFLLVVAVYDGNVQRFPMVTESVTLSSNAEYTTSFRVPVSAAREDTILEAFAVLSENNPTAVTDTVFRLKK